MMPVTGKSGPAVLGMLPAFMIMAFMVEKDRPAGVRKSMTAQMQDGGCQDKDGQK